MATLATCLATAGLLLSATSALVFAAGAPIEGAFGIQLGASYTVEEKPFFQFQSLIVVRRPPAPNDRFLLYTIRIVPSSKVVASIEGMSDVLDSATCRARYFEVKSVLEEKYGSLSPSADESGSGILAVSKTLGDRNVKLECSCDLPTNRCSLAIRYTDALLESAAVREDQEADKKKAKSGL